MLEFGRCVGWTLTAERALARPQWGEQGESNAHLQPVNCAFDSLRSPCGPAYGCYCASLRCACFDQPKAVTNVAPCLGGLAYIFQRPANNLLAAQGYVPVACCKDSCRVGPAAVTHQPAARPVRAIHSASMVGYAARRLTHIWTPPFLPVKCAFYEPRYDCFRISGF